MLQQCNLLGSMLLLFEDCIISSRRCRTVITAWTISEITATATKDLSSNIKRLQMIDPIGAGELH